MHPPDEQALLNLYLKEKNSKWLGLLLQRYTLVLFGVCMKYLKNEEEARDVVQQVFEKAIEEIGKYKIDHFGGWIYRIAINQCLMKLRKKGAVSVELTERMEFTQQEDAEEWLMQKEQKLDSMHEALQTLPEEQRICIEGFYLKGQSYRIIGEETGYTILQIKSFIQNGKRKLKILLHSKKEV